MNVERELLALEQEFLDPSTRRSRSRLDQLLHESFTEVGVSGRFWTRESIIAALLDEQHTGELPQHPIENYRISMLHPDGTIVLAEWQRAGVLRSTIWVLTTTGWQARYHQGTRAIDKP